MYSKVYIIIFNKNNKMETKLFKEMIKDESKAPREYIKLRKQMKDARAKQIISSIIRDERKHLRLLEHLR
jgi:rubrerythrin